MFSLAVANNSRLAPRLHLLVSIDQKVVEILNAHGPGQWIFHVGKTPQPDRIEWMLARGFHAWFFNEIKEDRVAWPGSALPAPLKVDAKLGLVS